MSIATKLVEMADAELSVLHANAARLQRSGTPTQRTEASSLMPAVEAEIAVRRERKMAAMRKAPGAVKRGARRAPAA